MTRGLSYSVHQACWKLLAVLIICGVVHAQTETGQINGKVVDPNGALVPNASITIKSVDTGSETTLRLGQKALIRRQILSRGSMT